MAVDFGTYHHSTYEESEKLRTIIYNKFHEAFKSISLDRNSAIKILDIGCGLGFTIKVAADFYTNAIITGIDNFSGSLINSSLNKARTNIEKLGIKKRCTVEEADILDFKGKFDLVISNLVFHNMGSARFQAYKKVYSLRPDYFITGDIFFAGNYENPVDFELSKISDMFLPVTVKNVDEISNSFKILILKRI
ncbi:MAG: class I SAM-dependent methyltransferase [Ferroplasma sp.]|uniref:class I SAM-dependent methyltransferase n=1 Tax=Ferroplasma sp. TaxID=2591003 RepID=UPI0028166F9B|nr:class I SAM-dependent methyltransferase [Ferroplasma sp.]WMT51587.1 MAG: class I SAM-dependent methyltransferase [Ferroplasma sp.]